MIKNIQYALIFLLVSSRVFSQHFTIDVHRITIHDNTSITNDDTFFRYIHFDAHEKYEPFVVYRKWGKDSVILFEAQVKGQLLNGYVKRYSISGKLLSMTNYIPGELYSYDNRRQFVSPHKDLSYMLSGIIHGKEEIYYEKETGKGKPLRLFKTCNYSNGKLNGLMLEYFENGTIMRSTEWKDDVKEGAYFDNYEEGQIRNIGHYHKNEQHNWWMCWYEDGSLKSKVKYFAGVADTAYNYYRGGIIHTINFRSSVHPNKPSFVYDSLGRLLYYAYMNKRGQFDSIEVEYYANGQKKYQVIVNDGKWEGAFESWYQNGKTQKKGQYKNGISFGKWFYYDEKGRLLRTEKIKYEEWPEAVEPAVAEEAMEIFDIATVTESLQFPGGSMQSYSKQAYKLPKGIKKIELVGFCDRNGKMKYTVKTQMKKKDLEKFNKFLERYQKISPFKLNGRSYNCVTELSFGFN